MNTTHAKPIQAILDHIKQHLSLSEKDIAFQETPIPRLPHHMAVFSVEEKGSYGNALHRYVICDGDLFSSVEDDSLERLLKKEDYLRKKQLTADQLVILFRLLKAGMRDTEIIRAGDLAEGGVYEKYRGKVIPPTVEESQAGVKVVFWAKHLRKSHPDQWVVTISPDYTVEYHHESLQTQQ